MDYRFVSQAEFQEMVDGDALLEHANVYGKWYGVPRAEVGRLMGEGWDVVLRTDVQGAASVKALDPEAVTIFISPGDLSLLEARMEKRGESDPEDRTRRLETARKEMEAAADFDHVVVNPEGELDAAVEAVRRVLEGERGRA